MKTLGICLIVTAATITSGCGSIADFYDRQDSCQTGEFSELERQRLGRPQGYRAPDWCGASSGRIQIYNQQNRPIGYIRAK